MQSWVRTAHRPTPSLPGGASASNLDCWRGPCVAFAMSCEVRHGYRRKSWSRARCRSAPGRATGPERRGEGSPDRSTPRAFRGRAIAPERVGRLVAYHAVSSALTSPLGWLVIVTRAFLALSSERLYEARCH